MTNKNAKIINLALTSAKKRIESSQKLLEIGNFSDSVSRAYYAVLDAARAALMTQGEMPKSHAGTIMKFNQHFIKTDKIDKKFGPLISKLEKARTEADYQFGVEFTKEEAKGVLETAEEFVAEVKKVLDNQKG